MGDARGLARVCKSGAALDEKDEAGNGVIHLACEIGDEELVEIIIGHYKDEPSKLDEPNVNGQTAIFVAARVGDSKIVSRLLASRCDPTRRDNTGFTPLHVAAVFRHVEICQLFLARGCDAFTYDHQRQSAANIAEAGWSRICHELRVLKHLQHSAQEETRSNVLASPKFLNKFMRAHAPVLRKYFPRKAYELAGSLLHSLEAVEASADAKRHAKDLERQARRMRKMRRPSFDPEAADSDSDDDAEGGAGGGGAAPSGKGGSGGAHRTSKEGFNLYGAGPNGTRVTGRFTASHSYFNFLATTEEEAGETEGAAQSLAMMKGQHTLVHDHEEGGHTETHDFDLTHVHLVRTFEALQAEVKTFSVGVHKQLGEERKKYGELRDIITPGWRDAQGGFKKKKTKKALEKQRLTAERKQLVSANRKSMRKSAQEAEEAQVQEGVHEGEWEAGGGLVDVLGSNTLPIRGHSP